MSSAFEGLPKTPNLKLNKPGYDNVADIEALNENADILDEEIQGIKNTFVKSVNGINAGDDGNVDLGIIPIAKGGTGATTAEQARTNLDLGNVATLNTVPIANGGTGANTVAGARNALGLGNTTGALPIANGGTGATTAADARTNLGLSTAVTSASISGKTITLTFANGTTKTLTTQDTNTSNWSISKGGTGWTRDNTTGLTICWGTFSVSGNTTGTITFPKAMTTAYFITYHKHWWNGTYGGAINTTSLSGTQANWQAEGKSGTARYFVVGVS